ncbi:MAG: hypothetical protein AB7O96_05920 [Pseudobdellovibrionaceae bacterium]
MKYILSALVSLNAVCAIATQANAAFTAVDSFGSPRITAEMIDSEEEVGPNRLQV